MTESKTATSLPTVWRINLKPGSAQDGVDPRKFCLGRNCLGVGWAVDDEGPLDWEVYSPAAKLKYPDDKSWWPALNAIRNRMSVNDKCWTRDQKGIYHLARITGPWLYSASRDHREVDVVNLRHCEWVEVGPVARVPGKVVNSFIPARTVQVVDDETVRLFSAYCYNSRSTSPFKYELPKISRDAFSLLSSEDCEDLVALMMQRAGYYLIPSSCKSDTAAYEWIMIDGHGGYATAQVKNGAVDLDTADYSDFPGRVYLFTTKGRYVGDSADNVVCLSPDQVRDFINGHMDALPARIKAWLEILEQCRE